MSKRTRPIRVGILMGSANELERMNGSCEALEAFGVGYELRVLSAHRTPDLVAEYAAEAEKRGLGVIIAGAGAAAHLAGVVASHTPLPVIGVPLASTRLGGLDSLLAMVQMPRGVPVGVVAIDNSYNAGLLAVQILAVSDDSLRRRFVQYKNDLADRVVASDKDLRVTKD